MKAISSAWQAEFMSPLAWCLGRDQERPEQWAISDGSRFCSDPMEYFSMIRVLSGEGASFREEMIGMIKSFEFIRNGQDHDLNHFHWGDEKPIERTLITPPSPHGTNPDAVDFTDTRNIVQNLIGLSDQAIEVFRLLQGTMHLRLQPLLLSEQSLREHLKVWTRSNAKQFYDNIDATLTALKGALTDSDLVEGRIARSDRFREKMICANPSRFEDIWDAAPSSEAFRNNRPEWCTPDSDDLVHRWLSEGESVGLFECADTTTTAADRYQKRLAEYCDSCVDWDMIERERTTVGSILYQNTLNRQSCKNPTETVWCSTNEQPTGFYTEEQLSSSVRSPSCGEQWNTGRGGSRCEPNSDWDENDRWTSQETEHDCKSLCERYSPYGGEHVYNHCSGISYFPETNVCYLKPSGSSRSSSPYPADRQKYGPSVDAVYTHSGWSASVQRWESKGMFGRPASSGLGRIRNQLFRWGEQNPAAEPIDPLVIELTLLDRSLTIARDLADAASD